MRKIYSFILLNLCFLGACTFKPDSKDTCIQPLTTFAYYTGQGTPYPNEPIPPPKPWVMEESIDMQYPSLLAVRTLPNKEKEFWIWESAFFSLETNLQQQRLFVQKTNEIDLNPILLDDELSGFASPIERIFIAPDNSVWVVYQTSERSTVPILGKYDEITDSIVSIEKLSQIKHYPYYQTVVLMDQNTGIFWFFVPYGHIYSYDPASDKLVEHISISDMNPASAVITPDGNIYIYLRRHVNVSNEEHDALFLYSPQTETMEYVLIGLEVDSYSKSLFIDHTGRLWASSFGWREPDGKWYQTIRSPLFVLAQSEATGERIYHWIPPDIKYESPDNVLWFTGVGGTYFLDFNKGEWCWVSTSSELEKDTDGNLWMMVDKKIYSLQLSR